MDLSIPPELEQMKDLVRRFVTNELAPLEQSVDAVDHIEPETMRELRRRAVEVGIYGYNLPEEVGGGGVSPLGDVLISEEMGRTSVALAEALGRLPMALSFATPEQIEWLVRPVLLAEKVTANALTEPNAGSDLGGLQTRAVPNGEGWKITGYKQFICGAEIADYILLLAVTDPSARLREKFTTFVIDRTAPGLEMITRFHKMGWRGLPMNAFALDGCIVGPERILGRVGGGFETIMASVNTMRLSIAARCVGAASLLLTMARDYALERSTFGSLLADHQAIQFKLADMDVELEAARLLVLAGAWKIENKDRDLRIAASRAKLFATEMAGRVADQAMQILGASGYMADLPIERMYRDLRGFRIGEGASEIQRIQIARNLLASR
jgi:alkylation response protein AidB-like acyl-CoA dehydrogenase